MAPIFYATTPIYYINDVPHLGTAYTTIAADVLTRYHRLRGHDSFFLTGTDEHGLKIERAAQERGMSNDHYADTASAPFKETWPKLSCAFDGFIRTTESRHERHVQEIWRKVRNGGDLYLGHYEGWYCVGCEGYYTEKELDAGNICPTHKAVVERVKEPSYFFRLQKYGARLLEFYQKNPSFVAPPSRMNEVVSFVRAGLDDLSVSRTTFHWGVPVPDDPDHVMYVWFDALANYWSAVQEPTALRRFWPPSIHLVGKDILRFHAIYWPAFLMAAGFSDEQLPKQVFAHGFLTFNGQKMSKSLRNTVKPVALAETFGVDPVRYYLMRAIAFGQDGDFNLRDLVQRYNSELGDSLGNLLNRVLHQCHRVTEARSPERGELGPLEQELHAQVHVAASTAAAAFDAVAPHRALDAIFSLIGAANQYVDRAAPWTEIKRGNVARVGTILATGLDVLETIAFLIWPVMPGTADQIRSQLALGPISPEVGRDQWPVRIAGRPALQSLGQPSPLFPRIDKSGEAALVARLGIAHTCAVPPAGPPQPSTAEPQPAQVTYDDFAKIDLRVGVVVSAERIQGKDKLLSLKVDLGETSPRPLVAGIAPTYAPEDLIGKCIVVVSNLAPRKFGKGLVSHGMLLAAKSGERLTLVAPLDPLPGGSEVS